MTTGRRIALLDDARGAFERGDLAAAESACREIVTRDKRNVNAWQLLGLIANRRGWFDKAVPCFEKCVKLRPDDPLSHCQLASARMYQGRFDDARRGFDLALSKRRGFPPAVRGRAELHERGGEIDTALDLLAAVAESQDAEPETILLLASLTGKAGRSEDAIRIAERGLQRPGAQPVTRRKLGFVVGTALARLGRHDEAFEAFRAANETDARPFDIAQTRARNDRLIAFFSAERVAKLGGVQNESELPVFIVGMPRSGSTLVEQIIAAHPLAYGAGEITAFLDQQREMPGKIRSSREYPDWIDDLPDAALERLGRPYLSQLSRLCRDATRIADKNLLNYIHLGLISILYPHAHVIHCRRNPLDNAVSCFTNDLSPVGFPWSTNLRDIGLYHREYERLMEHWIRVLDQPILDLSYEEMVANQEDASRAIIEFCGLEWDDACLRFYETGRAVTTLSYDQVRKPIYRTAVDRWRRYDTHLDPLREALGMEA